jgi:hypothetical protein
MLTADSAPLLSAFMLAVCWICGQYATLTVVVQTPFASRVVCQQQCQRTHAFWTACTEVLNAQLIG